jgi:flagellar biosynthetic protein FliP
VNCVAREGGTGGAMKRWLFWLSLLVSCMPILASAEPGLAALKVEPGEDGSETYTVTIQVLMFMTALSLLPAALMMMTSFTRIVIVLAILRQALGTQSSPSNQVIIGLSLFLSLFIMMPVFDRVYDEALGPYLEEEIPVQEAVKRAAIPFRGFMLEQTRDDDLMLFANISNAEEFESAEDVPFSLLMPAFVTSELKTAFQIGFLILIPFLVIDLVIATLLMSMGMMMLSPMIISLPFKIMLFVLIDGWSLIMGTLASSFSV